ncbi:MAG: hypothetical protein H6807_12060 [Planctomycetes bacterium]|nr:hypothetical protein [Planctomycetota bacterium]
MSANRPFQIALCLFTLTLLATGQADQAALRRALLEGVTRVGKPGVPGPVAALDDEAFALVLARKGKNESLPVIAAATPGKGRVVLFGHGGYLSAESLGDGDGGRLVDNAFRFVAGGRKKPRVGLVGHGHLRGRLDAAGFEVAGLEAGSWSKRLDRLDVLVLGQDQVADLKEVKKLVDWVRGGGGLVASGLIWGWEQLNPTLEVDRDLLLNRALRDLGLMLCGGTIDTVIQPDAATAEELDACHAGHSLLLLERGAAGRKAAAEDIERAGVQLGSVLFCWPEGDESWPKRIDALLAAATDRRYPEAKKPLRAKDALDRLFITVDHIRSLRLAPEKIAAAPTAADFPGQPGRDTRPISRKIRIDPRIPGWQSTGLYARAGELLRLELPARATRLGARLRIGCHADRLWDLADWKRQPDICRDTPVVAEVTRFASPHGGLVYLDLPKAVDDKPFDLVISGAVEAPLFVLGQTDPAEWKNRIRKLDAPWAELACDRVILTVRAEAIRAIEDPTELMTFWKRVVDLYPVLSARPDPVRPWRYVADRQISAGYLHSGYPIMMHLHHSEEIVALKALRDAPAEESHGWGFWHELGHNHQQGDWTFAGTTEVTCNLYSLYVDDQIRGVAPVKHSWPASARMKVAAHVKGDRDFERWKKDPGLALWTYILIQEEFGWEPFISVFGEYARLTPGERPKGDQNKRDQFMSRLSRVLGRDLGPYFEAWGIPISATARKTTADLKPWMPQRIAAFRELAETPR